MSRVLSISVGAAAPLAVVELDRRDTVVSGIVKTPRSTLEDPRPVALSALGFEGDEQVDRTVHGGLDKAVYVYPAEHYPFWRGVREQMKVAGALEHGGLGENLTIEGLLETQLWVGDRLTLGDVELRVESPRQPCYKFNARIGFVQASKLMVQSGFCGFYCSVVRPGSVHAGCAIALRAGDRIVSIQEMHRLKNRNRRGPSN